MARGAGVFWSCLGGLLIFRWTRELYGAVAGLFALALWCFEPNILAYAQIVSPDLPCSVAALLAGYLFWKYLKEPIWPRAAAVGLALGLALLTKFTLLVLLPVGIVVLVAARRPVGTSVGGVIRQRFGHSILALVILVLVINLGYLFEGTGRRLGDIPFVSEIFTGEQLDSAKGAEGAGNRFRETWLGRLPVPVPEDWLRGIDVQRRDFEQMQNIRPSYLRGEWRQRGWWYYYLYALGVKLPVGLIVLALAGLWLGLIGSKLSGPWRDELPVYLPAAAIIILVSSQTGFNHHMRYVLPALPFLIVGAGKLIRLLNEKETQSYSRWRMGLQTSLATALLFWTVVSSLRIYPHSMSYFNEIAGGPENGHAHLVDSNIDWGQDVFFLKKWMDEHPEARPMKVAVANFIAWDILGEEPMYPPSLQHKGPESGPQPGWYAMSVNALRGMQIYGLKANDGTYFLRLQPVARAGYSIYIYKVDRDECNRVRQELGWPPLPTEESKP